MFVPIPPMVTRLPTLVGVVNRVVDADGATHRIADDVNGIQTQCVDERCPPHRMR